MCGQERPARLPPPLVTNGRARPQWAQGCGEGQLPSEREASAQALQLRLNIPLPGDSVSGEAGHRHLVDGENSHLCAQTPGWRSSAEDSLAPWLRRGGQRLWDPNVPKNRGRLPCPPSTEESVPLSSQSRRTVEEREEGQVVPRCGFETSFRILWAQQDPV